MSGRSYDKAVMLGPAAWPVKAALRSSEPQEALNNAALRLQATTEVFV